MIRCLWGWRWGGLEVEKPENRLLPPFLTVSYLGFSAWVLLLDFPLQKATKNQNQSFVFIFLFQRNEILKKHFFSFNLRVLLNFFREHWRKYKIRRT